MATSAQEKKEIIATHGGTETNTGSSEAQIALFTKHISDLTAHLKIHKKDYSTQLSLVKMVGKRRSLLNYLAKKDITRYRAIISKLGLRQ
jgi:small subunit ribosomal protein S15